MWKRRTTDAGQDREAAQVHGRRARAQARGQEDPDGHVRGGAREVGEQAEGHQEELRLRRVPSSARIRQSAGITAQRCASPEHERRRVAFGRRASLRAGNPRSKRTPRIRTRLRASAAAEDHKTIARLPKSTRIALAKRVRARGRSAAAASEFSWHGTTDGGATAYPRDQRSEERR